MCGRFVATTPPEEVARHFGADGGTGLEGQPGPPEQPGRRWNVAPQAWVRVVHAGNRDGGRQLDVLRWGLVPSWARDPSVGARMINARAETAAERPAYRAAFARRRCLIPADGFYEWKKPSPAPKGSTKAAKQPYYFSATDGGMLAFAGLWEIWRDAGGEVLRTCTIVTTSANSVMRPVHDRMPVILDSGTWEPWLDVQGHAPAEVAELLVPAPPGLLGRHPVSTRVNNAAHEGPDLVEPVPG